MDLGEWMAERRTDKPKPAKRMAPAVKPKAAESPPAIVPALPAVITPPEPEPQADHGSPVVPRLYLLHPLLIGPLPAWDAALERAAALGFNGVLIPPPFATGGSGHLYQIGDPDLPHPALEASGDSASAPGGRNGSAASSPQALRAFAAMRPHGCPAAYGAA